MTDPEAALYARQRIEHLEMLVARLAAACAEMQHGTVEGIVYMHHSSKTEFKKISQEASNG